MSKMLVILICEKIKRSYETAWDFSLIVHYFGFHIISLFIQLGYISLL